MMHASGTHCQGGRYQYMLVSYGPGVRVRVCANVVVWIFGWVGAWVRDCACVSAHRCVRVPPTVFFGNWARTISGYGSAHVICWGLITD